VSKFLRRDTRVSLALNKRNTNRPTDRIESEACEGFGVSGRSEWRSDWTIFELQAALIEFGWIWSDDLPRITTVRGGGRMSYEVIVIFNLKPFSSDCALDALETACTRPPARAPDRPLSTR